MSNSSPTTVTHLCGRCGGNHPTPEPSCAGCEVHSFGSAEAYADRVKRIGPLWCQIHNCDGEECVAGVPLPTAPEVHGG